MTRKPGKHRASAAIVFASFTPQTPPFGGRQNAFWREASSAESSAEGAAEGVGDFFVLDETSDALAASPSRKTPSPSFGTAVRRSASLSKAALTSAGVNPCRFAERAARVSATCRFFSILFSPFASRGFFWRRASSARRVAPGAEAPARPVLHAHAGAPSAPGAEAAAPAKAGGIQPPTLPLEPFAYVPSEKLEAYFEARPSSTAEECIAAAAAKYDDLASQLERRANGGEDATVDAPPSP